MTRQPKFGIQTNGIKHAHADPMPDIDTRFSMVKATGLFDYVDKTPAPDEIEAFEKASQKYDLPVLAGGWFYKLGEHKALLEQNLLLGKRLGSAVHNVQILSHDVTGKPVTNEEVVDCYLWAYDLGQNLGVTPCFEVHVNMWSEDFRRVTQVGKAVESRGIPFCMTLDHSHVIFKIDHPTEQQIQNIAPAVQSGDLILDPFAQGNVVDQWIDAGWVRLCHARSAIPNNPRNTAATNEHGEHGRGIQYPFKRPASGQYHAPWREESLEPWKESVRHLLAYHANDTDEKLGQISTEFIPNFDYGEGCNYSLFEQAVECVRWMRAEWQSLQAPH
ncbi:MAG: xylose isomerase [Burkholderiaceae bacterium]